MASILERVQTVVSDRLGVDVADVVPEAKLAEDLEADSLDLVELIMALEEEFETEIPGVVWGADGDRLLAVRGLEHGAGIYRIHPALCFCHLRVPVLTPICVLLRDVCVCAWAQWC